MGCDSSGQLRVQGSSRSNNERERREWKTGITVRRGKEEEEEAPQSVSQSDAQRRVESFRLIRNNVMANSECGTVLGKKGDLFALSSTQWNNTMNMPN